MDSLSSPDQSATTRPNTTPGEMVRLSSVPRAKFTKSTSGAWSGPSPSACLNPAAVACALWDFC